MAKIIDKRNSKEGYNIKIQETSQQICNSEKDSLMYFMRQCIQILNNLNIKCTSSDVKEIIINENRIKYSLTIFSPLDS